MRKKIAVIVMVVSFMLLAGFVGGLDMDSITITKGFMGSALSLTVFILSALIGGVIE